ncbi:GrpB family protein [Paenibacillus sp. LMG 31461]|uniref:GrpB family protein n=1 Tax=Paenibacillus plantarum TaxID=2654975 RepID=A0ABX1XAG9_9BACL|nr:GrpB family protein [Paenibacillus plantarum]NOU65437.1 GrpB family protein [Paenibacillus plantarum]
MERQWTISPWTNEWNQQFEVESNVLQDIFQSELVDIHHVGSTSVPSIGYAKPIIDILIIVKNIEQVDVGNEQMIDTGYRVRGENGIPNRRYFSKGDLQRTHHVHIYQQGDSRILTYLDFKAYLLQHPAEAAKYGQLKLDILASYPNEQYQQVKEDRINHLVEKALRWGEEERKRLE